MADEHEPRRRHSEVNARLQELAHLLAAQMEAYRQLPQALLPPIFALREKHFVYSVIEHAADESVRDGEALDAKLSALLAAQAAITAIFLDKQGPYLIVPLVFTALTIVSICSLRRRRYRRAPNPAFFAQDYLSDPDSVRSHVIKAKVEAIKFNDKLAQQKGRDFTVSLWLTVLALVVLLGWKLYTNGAHG